MIYVCLTRGLATLDRRDIQTDIAVGGDHVLEENATYHASKGIAF